MRVTKSLTSALILAWGLVSGLSAQEEQRSYGFVRTLEGSGTIVSADTDGLTELGLNHPILSGDRLFVDPGSRVELVLPDFNIVRLSEETELEFSRLAFSAETDERVTTLLLTGGEMQIVITEHALGDELPAIVLPNATVFLHEPGSYRITAYQDVAYVTVREGYAEVSTERGSAVARSDEAVQIEGGSWPAVSVLEAAQADDLELWGDALMMAAESGLPTGIDPALGYAASSLNEAGEWVEVEGGGSAWSPYVEESWRPYTRGSWVTTPAGMNWIGYEPWGWVTGHYGYWSQHGSYGWLWYPGAAWAPAWVHWYWGPNWVGWVPFGVYDGFYGGHLGLGLGYYGHAGGYWHHYSNWTFCPTYNLGHGNGHYSSGRDMPRRTGRTAVPRGVITTDTRGVTALNWRDGVAVGEALTARARREGYVAESVDVTPFVARERDLSTPIVASISRSGRGSARSGGTVRQPAERHASGVRAWSDQRSRVSSASPRIGSIATPVEARQQAWRDRASGRRIYSVDRSKLNGATVDSGRQSAFESAGRVREAWRSESATGGGYLSRGSRDARSLTRDSQSRYSGSAWQSSSPARRVIDGVRSPSRGQTSSSLRSTTRSGSGRSTTSTGSRGVSRPAPRSSSASARSSGSAQRSSARANSSRSGGSKPSGSKSGGSKSGGGSAGKSRSGGSS